LLDYSGALEVIAPGSGRSVCLPSVESPGESGSALPRQHVNAAILFVDVRASSQIVRYVERHHSPEVAAELFTSYLTGCMQVIIDASGAECQPSGDAVLAVISGEERERIARAVEAAEAAIRFITKTFEPRNRSLLARKKGCKLWRPGLMRFEVVAGIDDGIITKSNVSSSMGDSTELVGGCVSIAAKLSDRVGPANAIGITADAYYRGNLEGLAKYKWRNRITKLGGKFRHVLITVPSLL
jgi:class 3 adenylate cyclase